MRNEEVPGLKQLTAAGQREAGGEIKNALHFNGLPLQAIGTRFALFQGEPGKGPPCQGEQNAEGRTQS